MSLITEQLSVIYVKSAGYRLKMIKNGFILNPEKELLPDYKISPFSNYDLAKNRNLPDSNLIDEYFHDRFKHNRICYTKNGRFAIHLALQHYNLSPEDCVTIFTTTGNMYISSCVTKEIEKFCQWSRKIEANTKLLFVNHEFGYPYEELEQLKSYCIPIIEDCAHSFFSHDENFLIGSIGDYVIYSFPKMFPLQIGGLLVSNLEQKYNAQQLENHITYEEIRYIKNVTSYYISKSEDIIKSRLENYNKLKKLLEPLNLIERLSLKNGIVPGVFMFTIHLGNNLLSKFKEYMYQHGIECSVFYGEKAFFIPIHQNLKNEDLIYFKEVISSFQGIC